MIQESPDNLTMETSAQKSPVVSKKLLLPFILITCLFALWGFANDITNPMVSAFQTVMEISNFKASLVQFAFYGGYFTMAIPAALFVKKYSYKTGVLIGLGLYAVGALLFYPAAQFEMFGFFLVAYYILTFGLAFLETTANPFILSMGAPETATRRLNLAQSFNPMGSLTGMFVAQQFILAALQSDDKDSAGNLIYSTLEVTEKATVRAQDLMVIRDPYIMIGLVVIVMLVVIAFTKMPEKARKNANGLDLGGTFKRLFANMRYREGVLAQVFYVGAQIMCWTFIIQYAENLGLSKAEAQVYNIVAMVGFLLSRFVSTFLMKYVNAGRLLMLFAIGGFLCISGTILLQGMAGLYCLVATSAFMSLMFPTIYGIALENVGNDAEIGAAGLVMAIVGGALMPPLQAAIIDQQTMMGMPAVNFSFILPLICFVVVALYGYRTYKHLAE
ncbi:L-fucose:H+ symporter permease [Rapidithrix thailandica]|uniref:L-fucose:H+ symporter permease n=1 Tax=Rapidithrix thailandica TaxID=413964 RepID=A0AAW9SD52_9BACT